MYRETCDDSIEDNQAKIFSETADDYPSGKNSNPEVSNESRSGSDSEREIDVISRGESGKDDYCETHINGTESISSSAGRSSSSSSSESLSNDLFQIEETFKFTESSAYTLASKSGKDSVSSSESPIKSEVDNSPLVPTSIYQVYNLSHSQKDMSPTVSPSIQVMDRSGRYDHSRIPSSVFEKSTNPMEWSLASNESLFSLHIGQPSFSREKIMYELDMSGELTKSGELDMNNRAPSVITEEPDSARKSVDAENLENPETSDEAFKLEEERLSEDRNKIKTLHQTTSSKSSKSSKTLHQTASSKSSKSSASSPPHKNGASEHSGASPLKKRAWTFCYCSNCSWVFCYFKLPTCKGLQCCWVFSCCVNSNRTEPHDHASPILTEAERNDFMEADIPRQQSKQASEVISNSNANCCNCCNNWFHCFSFPSCTWKLSCTMCKCCS